MRAFLILLISAFTSIAAFANNNLGALGEKDLAILASGAGCWLEDAKSKQFIYDDMSNAAIKIDSKVVKLNRKSGDWDSGFYNCGKSYEYSSDDQKINISIKMKPGKVDKCKGEMIVNDDFGESTMKGLRSNCGA